MYYDQYSSNKQFYNFYIHFKDVEKKEFAKVDYFTDIDEVASIQNEVLSLDRIRRINELLDGETSLRTSYDIWVEAGHMLYKMVLRRQALSLLKWAQKLAAEEKRGLRLHIVSSAPLIHEQNNWELLHDGEKFLGLSANTPIVRAQSIISSIEEPAKMPTHLNVAICAYDNSVLKKSKLTELLKRLDGHSQMTISTFILTPQTVDTVERSNQIVYIMDSRNQSSQPAAMVRMTFQYEAHGAEIEMPAGNDLLEREFVYPLFKELLNYQQLQVAVTNARQSLSVNVPGSYAWAEPRFYLTLDPRFQLRPPARNAGEAKGANLATTLSAKTVDPDFSAQDENLRRLQTRLEIRELNLKSVLEQIAQFGNHVPLFLITQQEQLEAQIEQINEQINELNSQ